MITNKQLKEYKDIYKTKFGVEISTDETLEKGVKLLNLLKIIIDYSKDKEKNKY